MKPEDLSDVGVRISTSSETSTRTRIETPPRYRSRSGVRSSSETSTRTRIETCTPSGVFPVAYSSSETSTRTRIETLFSQVQNSNHAGLRAKHPREQGLKLHQSTMRFSRPSLRAKHPREQGLKPKASICSSVVSAFERNIHENKD